MLAALYPSHFDHFASIFPRQQDSLKKHFLSLVVIEGSGERRLLLGRLPLDRTFTAVERTYLAQGKSLFWLQSG